MQKSYNIKVKNNVPETENFRVFQAKFRQVVHMLKQNGASQVQIVPDAVNVLQTWTTAFAKLSPSC